MQEWDKRIEEDGISNELIRLALIKVTPDLTLKDSSMKTFTNILKIAILSTWTLLASIMVMSYLFHVILKLVDGPTSKLYTPWMLGYLLITAIITIPFYYVVFKTKKFDLVS